MKCLIGSFFLIWLAFFSTPFEGSNIQILTTPLVIDTSNNNIDFKNQKYFLENHSNCPVIIIGTIEQTPLKLIENITISNLIVDGNKDNQDYEIWDNKENYIRNNCLTIRHAANITIRNCNFTNARSGNIVIEKNCNNITIENCFIADGFFDGIAGYDSYQCHIKNNVIVNNNYAGLSFDHHFNNNVIEHNHIYFNNLGVFLRNSDFNVFHQNTLKNKELDFYLNQIDDSISTMPKDNIFLENATFKNFIIQSQTK